MKLCKNCIHYENEGSCIAGPINPATGIAKHRYPTMERCGIFLALGCLVSEGRLPCTKYGWFYTEIKDAR
jgi:hypothetical protein